MPFSLQIDYGCYDYVFYRAAGTDGREQSCIADAERDIEVGYFETASVIGSGDGYRSPFQSHQVNIAVLTEVTTLSCCHLQFRYGPDRDEAVGSGIPQSEFPVSELQVYFICFRASRAFWAFPS